MIWFLKMMLGAAAIFIALIGGAVLFSNLISFFVPKGYKDGARLIGFFLYIIIFWSVWSYYDDSPPPILDDFFRAY